MAKSETSKKAFRTVRSITVVYQPARASVRFSWEPWASAQCHLLWTNKTPNGARRRSPDLAVTADRRSPEVAKRSAIQGPSVETSAGSGDPRTARRIGRRPRRSQAGANAVGIAFLAAPLGHDVRDRSLLAMGATGRLHGEYRGFINALLRSHPFKMKHG